MSAAIEQGAYIGVIDIDEDAGRTICGKLGDKAFLQPEMLNLKVR